MTTKNIKRLRSPLQFHPMNWKMTGRLARPLSVALGPFAFIQEVSLAAPGLDATRTQYALKIKPPVIDGEVNVQDPDEWRFAAGNSDYWHVFPDLKGFAADGIRGGELTNGQTPDSSDDLSFNIYAGFDDQNLYVAVVVKDDDVQTDTVAADSKNGQTWLDDSVEVFIDGANANAAKWNKAQLGGQFVITANNAYREEEPGNPGFGENAAWFAKKVSTDQSDVEQKPDLPTWEDDSVEIFFDVDNSKNFGGGTAQAAGVFEGQYTQTYKGFYYDGSPSKDAQKGVHWFGTGSLTPTGYQVEFKIPKTSLGSPKDDASIGFHFAVNDDDGVGDYSHIAWTGQAHHEYTYGSSIFSSKSAGSSGDGPKITGFSYANGAFSMTVPTTAGAKYDVEYSQDLKSWAVAQADVAGTGQPVSFTETDAARKARPAGFYRVRLK